MIELKFIVLVKNDLKKRYERSPIENRRIIVANIFISTV